jgi:hypothetical protein
MEESNKQSESPDVYGFYVNSLDDFQSKAT